jgi:hypothetical protein
MNAEHIQDLVYNWLTEHYPDGANWMDPDFDAFADVPIEIKMISAFDALEYNIANGGWSQVLWNCYGCWRELIAIAREGYVTIGAPERASALADLQALCEEHESACEAALLAEDGSMNSFAEFTRRSYGAKGNDWQRLFWSDSGIYEQRLAWLEQNEHRVRRAVDYRAA